MKETLSLLMGVGGSKTQQCRHLSFMKNACTNCKKPQSKCDNPTTIQFRYIDRNLSITDNGIRYLRDANLHKLMQGKKLHLVLDLDNTLIHATKAEKKGAQNKKNNGKDDDVYEILKGEMLVKLRPGARDFLEGASKLFDLSIYTMADEPYARQIATILESDSVKFSEVITREDCTKMSRKSLDVVLSHQRVVLIVDDLDDVWDKEDRGNVIKVEPYTYFQKAGKSDEDGHELIRVLGVLRDVHTKFFDKKEGNYQAAKDVRRVIEKVMSIEGINK